MTFFARSFQAYDSNSRPKEATILGFGSLKYNGDSPCTLREARILIYGDEACKEMIDSTGNNATNFKHALCAGYLAGGIDACQVIITHNKNPLFCYNFAHRVIVEGLCKSRVQILNTSS